MGRSSKQKGAKYERRIVALHHDEGLEARKVPLSGALADFPGDVKIAHELCGEVKARKGAAQFKTVRDWLGDNDLLFLQEIAATGVGKQKPNPKPLVVMGWDRYVELLKLFVEQQDAQAAE